MKNDTGNREEIVINIYIVKTFRNIVLSKTVVSGIIRYYASKKDRNECLK